ncbi:radical SAM family heme chaperone HemW [Cellvibrio polysaccharolyticus]|uniref:Heme chaperone HemW n=1 Tax=Cellvibrio polysaccharolyticus TaxID=2082724 RepID=A0A928YSD0_9GAMM|nr:radical SAM family heme chaperone HemW [Cellvibrio polysaccharolyticus]MBE8715632.1 radical SAM family heme chaperone HemW [Cellvibrio polysaccharolyticus]
MSLLLPPLALYIHIPWCIRKCPYCDFNSHEARTDMPEAEYVAALIHDLEQDQVLAQGRKITSIFFGGGTPSLFSAKAIGDILQAAERLIGFEPDIEITLEANPGTFEQEKFRGFRLAGVNRLSIGIQSFNQTQLQLLGRVHNRDEALCSADVARGAGFDNFNLDLMHGLPQQSVADALADLDQAIALAPSHLSWYQLTIEQNTAFYSAPPVLPEEDILVDIQDAGFQKLADAGYQQYEVSAYARDNRRARHNLNYWQFGDYLGIGAGAHGKITLPEKQAIVRQWKTRLPQHYLAAHNKIPAAVGGHLNSFNGGGEVLQAEALPLEFLMNALRLNDGVPGDIFQQRTGLTLAALQPQWQELVSKGLVNSDPAVLQTTALGQRFLNTILASYIRD